MTEFQVGDIIFYESTTFIGSIIRKITNSPFSHVALAVSPTEIVEANAFIRSRKVTFTPEKCKRIKVLRTKQPLTYAQERTLVINSDKLLNKGYDYLGITRLFAKTLFRFNLDGRKDDLTKLWCSEMVDYAYETIGIDLVPQIDNHYVSITDLEESPELVEAFELEFQAM